MRFLANFEFESLAFYEIKYNDKLHGCLILAELKLTKTFWETKFGSNEQISGPKLGVFHAIFSSLVHQLSLKLDTIIAWDNF